MATQRDIDDFQKAQQGILTGTNSGYYDQAKFNKEQAEGTFEEIFLRAGPGRATALEVQRKPSS